jgi:hypothetical protein
MKKAMKNFPMVFIFLEYSTTGVPKAGTLFRISIGSNFWSGKILRFLGDGTLFGNFAGTFFWYVLGNGRVGLYNACGWEP